MLGFLLTFILTTVIILYGSMQLKRLIQASETLVTLSTVDSFFTADDIISSNDGLKFAFALTAYDEVRELQEEWNDYGRIKIS